MANITLSEGISAWRSENQSGVTGHSGLLSKLQIGSELYDIKDPAVEALAEAIETRLSGIEAKEWTAVQKGVNAPKFATSVEQGVDGAITVTYSNLRDQALTDSATVGQFITSVSQDVNGVVTTTKGSVDAENVTFSETGWSATNTKAAILEVLTKVIGQSTDLSSADTVNAAKKYAEELVNNLAGQDWTSNAKKVAEIIEELENSENGNAWSTAIDKLAGLDIKYTQAEADAYNANLTGAISTETSLTAEQATALNGLTGVSSTSYEAGQTPAAEDAALYNASLEGAKSTSSTKTPQTVKQYVDNVIGQISDLTTEIINNEQVVAAALNDLNTNKANKADYATGVAHQVTASYATGTEALSLTITPVTVIVPAPVNNNQGS